MWGVIVICEIGANGGPTLARGVRLPDGRLRVVFDVGLGVTGDGTDGAAADGVGGADVEDLLAELLEEFLVFL
ncbi:MAG: hypothetical protein ACK58T_33445, partial [Phycisphaerae bacterium]